MFRLGFSNLCVCFSFFGRCFCRVLLWSLPAKVGFRFTVSLVIDIVCIASEIS